MKTQTYVTVVAFKDATGSHEAGKPVKLAAETQTDLQEIATLLNYGVIKAPDKD